MNKTYLCPKYPQDYKLFSVDEAETVLTCPQIAISKNNGMKVYGWCNGEESVTPFYTIGTVGKSELDCSLYRVYIHLDIPLLQVHPRIKKAELQLMQHDAVHVKNEQPRLQLHQVKNGIIDSGHLQDFEKMDLDEPTDGVCYIFNITGLLNTAARTGTTTLDLVVMISDERISCGNYVILYGDSYSLQAPTLYITYEMSCGEDEPYLPVPNVLEQVYSDYVDLHAGNTMFRIDDFIFENRYTPILFQHFYNAALYDRPYTANRDFNLQTADFSSIRLGLGWRLSLMQSMVQSTFLYDGMMQTGYVYIDATGKEHFFRKSLQPQIGLVVRENQDLYEDISNSHFIYDSCRRELSVCGCLVYQFDDHGRLINVKDHGENYVQIRYDADRISSVVDNTDETFSFAYDENGYLMSIRSSHGWYARYSYHDDRLVAVTYSDGRWLEIDYKNGKPSEILQTIGTRRRRVVYEYTDTGLHKVSEYGIGKEGCVLLQETVYTFEHLSQSASAKTKWFGMTENGLGNCDQTVVYTFDSSGRQLCQYIIGSEDDQDDLQADTDDANLLQNGRLNRDLSFWHQDGALSDSDFNGYVFENSLDGRRVAYQDVFVDANVSSGCTFTLSGWAKGHGLVDRVRKNEKEPLYQLRAEIFYHDNEDKPSVTDTFIAKFVPNAGGWQKASVDFKSNPDRTIRFIRVYCDFSDNYGTVAFDHIRLSYIQN